MTTIIITRVMIKFSVDVVVMIYICMLKARAQM